MQLWMPYLILMGVFIFEIFHDACKNIGHMPASIARQFLTKLALIIREDGKLDYLMHFYSSVLSTS